MDVERRPVSLRRIDTDVAGLDDVRARRQTRTRELIEEVADSSADGLWLSGRELDVLDLVARGFSDKEIALRIGVSAATVNTHLRHVYAKLRAHNRAHAVAIAMRCGMLGHSAAG